MNKATKKLIHKTIRPFLMNVLMNPHNVMLSIGQRRARAQAGMVMVIALILISVMMVIVSASLRWAGTEQAIAGNLRDREIAFQAAEIGLKTCELRLQTYSSKANNMEAATLYYNLHIRAADEYPRIGTGFYWEFPASWDIASPFTTTGLAMANPYNGLYDGRSRIGILNVAQEPRCIIENYALQPSNTEETAVASAAYRITARGAGQRTDSRTPTTLVYLQSILRM